MSKKRGLGFFKSVWAAVVNFEKYVELMYQKGSKVIKYFFLIILLFSLLASIASIINTVRFVQSNMNYFKDEFPELSFADNTLTIEADEPIKLHGNGIMENSILIVDTTATEEQISEYSNAITDNTTEMTVVILKDKFLINNMMGNGVMTVNFSNIAKDFNITTATKQDVVNFVSSSGMIKIYFGIYVLTAISAFLISVGSVFAHVIMISIFAFITSRIYRIKLAYASCVKISVYALTLPIILRLVYVYVTSLTGFVVQYFDYAYITIAYIYILIGILMIRNDMLLALNDPIKTEVGSRRAEVRNRRATASRKRKRGFGSKR